MKHITRIFAILLVLGVSPLVWSLDLSDVKAQGIVGETAKGYLELVDKNASAEVKALVKDVNGKRKAKYKKIAAKNKLALEAVEARAGEVAMDKTPSGQYVKQGGSWVKKP